MSQASLRVERFHCTGNHTSNVAYPGFQVAPGELEDEQVRPGRKRTAIGQHRIDKGKIFRFQNHLPPLLL